MNIGVIGSNGYFGKVVKNYFSKFYNVIPLSLRINKETDISIAEIDKKIVENKIELIINCSGLVGFEKCFNNLTDAYLINAILPFKIACICEEKNIKFYNISTEAVFPNGRINKLFLENDIPSPVTIYGKSKYLGELLIKEFSNCFSIRLPRLFGSNSQIVFKLFSLVMSGQIVRVADDIFSTPINVNLAVKELNNIISNKAFTYNKVFHISGDRQLSLYELVFELVSSNKKHLIIKCKDNDFKIKSFEKKPLISGLKSTSGNEISLKNSIKYFHDTI